MLPSYGCRAADKLCPWISTQFFARRVCSVTKFAGRAEKRPHCEKLSWTRQDIVTSRTWIRRFAVFRWATQSYGWSTLTFLA